MLCKPYVLDPIDNLAGRFFPGVSLSPSISPSEKRGLQLDSEGMDFQGFWGSLSWSSPLARTEGQGQRGKVRKGHTGLACTLLSCHILQLLSLQVEKGDLPLMCFRNHHMRHSLGRGTVTLNGIYLLFKKTHQISIFKVVTRDSSRGRLLSGLPYKLVIIRKYKIRKLQIRKLRPRKVE